MLSDTTGFSLLYFSLFLWFCGVFIAIQRYKSGSFEARNIAASILINSTFSFFIIGAWVVVFGGNEILFSTSEVQGRLRIIATFSVVYTFLYLFGHVSGFLDQRESADALAVLDLSILAAWTNEFQKVAHQPEYSNITEYVGLVGLFYGIPFGYILYRVIFSHMSPSNGEKRKAYSVAFVTVIAFCGTYLMEYSDSKTYWFDDKIFAPWFFESAIACSILIATVSLMPSLRRPKGSS